MRAFIGLRLPDHIRASLAALQTELAGAGAEVNWVEGENLHVTLKFLGEISPPQQEAVATWLGQIAGREEAFSLQLAELGAFPSTSSPRVLWVGLGNGFERVKRLAVAIEEAVARSALRTEERPFAAHVTIGRVRSLRHAQRLAERLRTSSWRPDAPWPVTSVTLFESVLGAGGPRYTVLAELPLGTVSP